MKIWQKTLFILVFGAIISMVVVGFVMPAPEAHAGVLSRNHWITCRPAGCSGTATNQGRQAHTSATVAHNANPNVVSVRARLWHRSSVVRWGSWRTATATTATSSTLWYQSTHQLYISDGEVVHGNPPR